MTERERLLMRAIGREQTAIDLALAKCSREVIAATYHEAAEAWRALGMYGPAAKNDLNAAAYGWRR